jgi:hypothetical protein
MKHFLGLLLIASVIIYACQKKDQSVGLNLLPGVKVIETRHFVDSTNISAYTLLDQNFRIDHDSIGDPNPRQNLLGSFNDPVFGYTNASYAAQFRLPGNPRFENKLYPENGPAVLDSLILQMSYKYVYGDTVFSQRIQVHELADSLYAAARYSFTYNIRNHIIPEIVGSLDYVPKFRTSSTKSDTTAQIIRIPMSADLGNRLLHLDTINYQSNTRFLNVFKGLYVETAPVTRRGALMRIDAGSHYLVLYYHNSKNDSLAFAYHVSANAADVSGYVHDYSRAPFFANLNQETGNDTLVYLQPTGGTKVKINIPALSNWKDSSNYIINKATLTVHVDTIVSDFKRFEIPPVIYLKYIDKNNSAQLPQDAITSASYYGGVYNPTTGTYSFNITQHFQSIIKGDIQNRGFYLVTPLPNTSPKRVIIKNGNSSRKMSLDVVYTRFKQ